MKSFLVSLLGLVLSVSVGAEPLLKGRVWLASGPAAGVQVWLFDLTDLRRSVGTTTDEAGYFALPLANVLYGQAHGPAAGLCVGAELSQSVQSLDDHSLPATNHYPRALRGVEPARAAAGDVGGWGTVGRGAYGALGRYGCGGSGGGRGRVHLSPQRRRAYSEPAHGAGRWTGRPSGGYGEAGTEAAGGCGRENGGLGLWVDRGWHRLDRVCEPRRFGSGRTRSIWCLNSPAARRG